jgi:hypothetical protein
VIAGGTFALPAAHAFGEPGFHQVLTASRRLPARLHGVRIVLTLSDASRPRQRCAEEHPLSGCATVDWSDDPSRPAVPPSGVFRNSITFRTRAGRVTLFLHPNGTLTRLPEPFRPG